MADSTDEDAARFLQSRQVGLIESEVELEKSDEGSDEVVVEGESESRLVIVESSKEGETVVETGDRDSPGSQSVRRVAGFGEVDDGSEEESASERDRASDDTLDSGGDGESGSTHSADNDARHDIDFLRDHFGESLAILVMAI